MVNFSIKENIKRHTAGLYKNNFLEKYRSEITTQSQNNNLDYMMDPKFFNRLFAISFKNDANNAARDNASL